MTSSSAERPGRCGSCCWEGDLGLPDGDGLDLIHRLAADPVLRRLRRVLLLTSRDAVDDRVAGLDVGADDHLITPFDVAELPGHSTGP